MGTLEWLMIVAAVAGLAALAVVLVARLVDDTAESVGEGGVTANLSAAKAAAQQIEEAARGADNVGRFANWNEWSRHYTSRCTRLEVLYSTISIEVDHGFAQPAGTAGDSGFTSGDGTDTALQDAKEHRPGSTENPSNAQIHCGILGP